MKIFEYQLINAGDMSGNITSPSQQVTFMINACVQAVYAGSPTGTLKLQISNDNVNWTDYSGSSQAISAAGSFAYLLADIGYPWLRVVYTFTSGTGTLNVTINAKGI